MTKAAVPQVRSAATGTVVLLGRVCTGRWPGNTGVRSHVSWRWPAIQRRISAYWNLMPSLVAMDGRPRWRHE